MSITLYEHADFKGRKLILTESTIDLRQVGFNNKTSSIRVAAGSYDMDKISAAIGNDAISSVKLVSNEITLYQHGGFKGTAMPLTESVPNLVTLGLNDKASSVRVAEGMWTLYEHINYQGKSLQLSPGSYDIREIRACLGNDMASSVKMMSCEIILYEHADFKGMALPLTQSTPNLVELGFNDKASSIVVVSGTWFIFEHTNYQGKRYKLTKGTYDYQKLRDNMGNDFISSVRLEAYE